MSRIIIATFASLLALAATPAAAQYGGSPDQQVDAPPGYAGPAAQPGSRGYAGKGDDEAMAAGAGAYDKNQGADEEAGPPPGADGDEGPPPPEAYEDQGPPPDGYDGGPGTCRRSDGTTGAIVGGGAGALVGRGIDRHGERGTGTILGAVIGALVGHAVAQGAACR